jgi:quinolinate synthase
MKRNTIEKVLLALQNEAPVVKVEDKLRERAWKSIQRMLEI